MVMEVVMVVMVVVMEVDIKEVMIAMEKVAVEVIIWWLRKGRLWQWSWKWP